MASFARKRWTSQLSKMNSWGQKLRFRGLKCVVIILKKVVVLRPELWPVMQPLSIPCKKWVEYLRPQELDTEKRRVFTCSCANGFDPCWPTREGGLVSAKCKVYEALFNILRYRDIPKTTSYSDVWLQVLVQTPGVLVNFHRFGTLGYAREPAEFEGLLPGLKPRSNLKFCRFTKPGRQIPAPT